MDEICKKLKNENKCHPETYSCGGTGDIDGTAVCTEYLAARKELLSGQKPIPSTARKIPNTPKIHELKSDPPVFQTHWDDKKPADLRQALDRTFNEGDIIIEREFDRNTQRYSGREIVYRIISMVRSPAYGLPTGGVLLLFHPVGIKTEGNLKPRLI